MKKMKRYFLIIITLILCGLTTVGQTSNFETRYMQTHEKYKQSLDPVSYINIEKNVRDGYVFMMDVATNYPVSDNPMKYFYEYTPPRSLEEIAKDILALEKETD